MYAQNTHLSLNVRTHYAIVQLKEYTVAKIC